MNVLVVAGSRDAVRRAGLTGAGDVFILGSNVHLRGKQIDHVIAVSQHPKTIGIWLESPHVASSWAHRAEPPTVEYV